MHICACVCVCACIGVGVGVLGVGAGAHVYTVGVVGSSFALPAATYTHDMTYTHWRQHAE